MSIVVNGSGTITGISTGGLPDGSVDVDTLAANSVTAAKIVDGTIVDAEVTSLAASKLTGALPAISGASLTNLPAASADSFFASSGLSTKDLGIGLHIKTGDSGVSSINAAGNTLVLEDDGGVGITMLTGSSSNASIIMGDSESNYQGVLLYDHSSNAMKLITAGSIRLQINSDGNIIAGQTSGTGYMLGDGDTGIVESGDDSFQVRLAGSNVFMFSGSEGRMRAPTTGAVNVMNAAGSASAPVYSFNDDTNTGMYRVQADQMAFSTGGTQRLRIYDSNNKGALALTPEFASGPIFNSGQLSFADDVERTYPGVNTGALIAVGYYADNNGARYHHGLFWASYGIGTSTVNVLGDPANRFRGTDTDGNMCCMSAAGSSNFRIKNRLGVTTNVSINIIQMQGN